MMKEAPLINLYEKPTVDIIYMEPEGIIAASGETGSSGSNYDNGGEYQLDSWY